MQYCKKLIIISLFLAFLSNSLADSRHELFVSDEEWERTQRAIRYGLKYIARNQNMDKGFFGTEQEEKYAIAVTSFACLALMAGGNVPGRGEYGHNVDKGLQFILKSVDESGYISGHMDESRMHGHGFATLFLAQAYGMAPNETIRNNLVKAIRLIIKYQTPEGGWGYFPGDNEHEGSITVCELQALRAARNVGILVPKKSIEDAITYLKRSANPDGSFKYRLGMNVRRKSFPLTAAGISSLNATGDYDSPEIKKGLEFMWEYLPPHNKVVVIKDDYYQRFYYYGHFYAAQAMYQAPSHTNYWRKWFPAIRDELLTLQNQREGYWGGSSFPSTRAGSTIVGKTYATAIATLILQIPSNYLPIFQK